MKKKTTANWPVVAFAIPPEMKNEIVALAKENERTLCAQMRVLLRNALKKREK